MPRKPVSEAEEAVDDFVLPIFPRPPHRSSLQIFCNSIWAFLLREIKLRFESSRLGYFWGILDPLAGTAMFVALRAVIRGHRTSIDDSDPIFFFMYGCVAFFTFNHIVAEQTNTINASRGLFNYRQVRPIDVLIAGSLIEWLLMAMVFGVFCAVFWLIGRPVPIEQPAILVFCFVLLGLLGFSAGLCFEVYATVYPDMRRVFALIHRPLFLISGSFFTINMVPQKYQALLLWNPILHIVDLSRDAGLPGYASPASFGYVMMCIVVFMFIGLTGYHRHMNRLI
jgi:capsular polysaccharide transport system permease protein